MRCQIATKSVKVGLSFWLGAFGNVSLKVILSPSLITAATLILCRVSMRIRAVMRKILLGFEDSWTIGLWTGKVRSNLFGLKWLVSLFLLSVIWPTLLNTWQPTRGNFPHRQMSHWVVPHCSHHLHVRIWAERHDFYEPVRCQTRLAPGPIRRLVRAWVPLPHYAEGVSVNPMLLGYRSP